MQTATDLLFADALDMQSSSLLAPSLMTDDHESPDYVLGCMWDAFVSPDSALLLPPPAQTDEPAAFVFHMNRDASDDDSCGGSSRDVPSDVACESPTLITSTLLTPIKENRAKTKASRGGAAAKPKRAKSAAAGAKRAKVAAAGQVAVATVASAEVATIAEVATSAEVATAVATEAREDEGNVSDGEVAVDPEDDAADATSMPSSPGDDNSKRVQRMMRNRASAAESRKRKRKQVEECEALVQSLKDAVKKLQEQNDELRRANALASAKQQELPMPPPIDSAAGA